MKATQELFSLPEQIDRPVELTPPYQRLGVTLRHGDFLAVSAQWSWPTVIIADGPYGVGSFPGDPVSHEALSEWYRPHIVLWSERALPETTLWFWNTVIGWASVHPMLVRYQTCIGISRMT